MNKRFLFLIIISLVASNLKAQPGKIDTVAISILDHMSAIIGDLNSCEVTVSQCYDVHSKTLGLVKHSDQEKLYMHGPDKLLVNTEGDKGTRSYYYNGKTFTYFSNDKNQYAQIAAPSTIMGMVDSVNKNYGVLFPMADFFYPSFVDDIIAESKTLAFIGLTKVHGVECFHIAGTAKDKTFQFWISNDALYLPLKMVIVYTDKDSMPQYEAEYSGWQINPNIPDALFEFTAPPMAKKIKLVSNTAKK